MDEWLETPVKCKYCDWEGQILDCLGVLDGHPSCPKCGCGVKEIQRDREA